MYERTKHDDFLGQWSKGRRVISLFHGFWRPGTALQQNWKGCLASLLSQMLLSDPDVSTYCEQSMHGLKHTLDDWSVRELETCLRLVIEESPHHKCLFLDALDEIKSSDDLDRLVEFVNRFENELTHLKICMSLRPLEQLASQLQDSSILYLPDYTRHDIYKYACAKISKNVQLVGGSATVAASIAEIITQRADGVFLWVHYVIEMIATGILVNTDLKSLFKSIDALPKEMEALYQQMWDQNSVYTAQDRETTAKIFSLARYLPMTVFQFGLMLNEGLINQYLETFEPLNWSVVHRLCRTSNLSIKLRTAGLLECVHTMPDSVTEIDDGLDSLSDREHKMMLRQFRVKYLHQTVQTFLEETTFGKQITSSGNVHLTSNCDTLYISSFLVSWIQGVTPVSSLTLFELLYSGAWSSSRQSVLLEDTKLICQMTVHQSLGDLPNLERYWFLYINRTDKSSSTSYDFEGLAIAASTANAEYMLTNWGENWSPHYKGYLAMCLILYTVGIMSGGDGKSMVETLKLLDRAGADMSCLQAYISRDYVLAFRSPASRLILELTLRVLQSSHRRNNVIQWLTSDLSSMLAAVELEDQELSIFWDVEHETWHSSSSGVGETFLILTFKASDLFEAFMQASQGFRSQLEMVTKRSVAIH